MSRLLPSTISGHPLSNLSAEAALRAGRLIAFTSVFAVLLVPAARAGGRSLDGVVNLNTAPIETLSLLPGIGPSKARGIVAYRTRRSFRTVDELVRVKGIGRRMLREIRGHLAVAGPSTARGVPEGTIQAPAPPQPAPRPPAGRVFVAARPPAAVRLVAARSMLRPGAERRLLRASANHCSPPP